MDCLLTSYRFVFQKFSVCNNHIFHVWFEVHMYLIYHNFIFSVVLYICLIGIDISMEIPIVLKTNVGVKETMHKSGVVSGISERKYMLQICRVTFCKFAARKNNTKLYRNRCM